MATQIISPVLDDSRYILTSEFSNIKATTDKDHIVVSLICESGLDGKIETFYSTTLFAFNGVVELYDVGTLIEEYFRLRNKVADIITIVFDTVSIDARFLYCEYAMPDFFNPGEAFFVAARVQRVHQDSIVTISAINHGTNTPFVIKAVGHNKSDGTFDVAVQHVYYDIAGDNTCHFHVADIIKWALGKTEKNSGADLLNVLFFSIEYAGIQKICYIVPAAAYLTFSFRNIFNVEEFIDVVGVMTTKTDVSHDTAVCNGCSKQYDRIVTRTYQVQTEPLTSEEIPIFEQFFVSHHVKMYLEGNDWDIIITDHTCEPSSDDDSLYTFKFSWCFADKRPRLFDSLLDGIMPKRRNIFDETFSPEYE